MGAAYRLAMFAGAEFFALARLLEQKQLIEQVVQWSLLQLLTNRLSLKNLKVFRNSLLILLAFNLPTLTFKHKKHRVSNLILISGL